MKISSIIGVAACSALLGTGIAHGKSMTPETSAKKQKIEVCFVLDTTSSMNGLIEGAKKKIWSIANQIVSAKPTPELKLALIGYRDRGDEYITKFNDLTDDIDSAYAKLTDFKSNGGGDGPESVNQALNEAVTKVSWSKDRDVLKIIFLVGDYPPHMDYQDDVKYPVTCAEAVKRDLIINTIQCGRESSTTPVWHEIAKLAEGSYNSIGQSGDMVAIATPVDAEITKLNTAIGNTLIGYGRKEERESVRSKQISSESAAPSTVADRLAYNAKTGKAVQGKGELIDALAANQVNLEEIKKDDLPPELQNMSKEALKKHVDDRKSEREALQKQLTDLLAKRSAFITAEMKKQTGKDSFDEKVNSTIREQAAKKGIIYAP